MSEKIKVSIIVLSYNQEKYIKETLESILNQEHAYTYEILVCDDASKDSTPAIIEEYAGRYKEIVPVLRKKNLGVVANYFNAVLKCKGQYIMICGGDDYWLPGKILKQVEYLDSHPNVGLIHGDAYSITEKGDFKDVLFGCEHNTVESLITNYNIWAATMAFRRDNLLQYISEIKPLEKKWVMEDFPISLWFKAKNRMAYLPGTDAAYRQVDNSLCHQPSPAKRLLLKTSTVDVVTYFMNKKYINLSREFFLRWKYTIFMSNYFIKNCKDYCEEILEECKDVLSRREYLICKLRLKNSMINCIMDYAKRIENRVKKQYL